MTRGRGTPPCQSLLSVMDQLPAAQGKNDSHTEQKAQVEMYYLEFIMCVFVCVDSLQDIALLQVVFASIF